jgi:hypothetical protein
MLKENIGAFIYLSSNPVLFAVGDSRVGRR